MQLHHLFIHNFSHFLSNVFNMLLQRRIVSRCQVITQKSYKPILDIQYIQTRNYIFQNYIPYDPSSITDYIQSTAVVLKNFQFFSRFAVARRRGFLPELRISRLFNLPWKKTFEAPHSRLNFRIDPIGAIRHGARGAVSLF